jgi:FKBP-type peptidyl-prolyl cis-trans isomerase
VVSEDGAQACELVDDTTVAAPEGWASENQVSEEEGAARAAEDAAEQHDAATEAAESARDSSVGVAHEEAITLNEVTGTGDDRVLIDRLSAYEAQGLTVDADGLVRYHGELVQGLVLDQSTDVTSMVWNDAGTVLLSVDGDTLRVMSDEEAQRLFG